MAVTIGSMRKLVISLGVFLGLCGSAIAQTMTGFPFPSSPPGFILTSGTSWTSSAAIPLYRVIPIGPGGGGGSSSGAGAGGNGASGNMTECDVYGNGTTYTYQIGQASTKAAAGASGTAGTSTYFSDSTNCAATSGNGGTAGTASAGAQGTAASANTVAALAALSSSTQFIGTSIVSRAGLAGVAGSTPVSTLGVQGGLGCAGANCTTNTAGQNGEILVIPEVY